MRAPFVTPTAGPDSWRALLADPAKHWRTGYSARALACCWEEAGGFPRSVRAALATAPDAAIREAELLLGIPEHHVALPGGTRPSQTDLWVLARGDRELISIAVEGKVNEAFGPTIGEWLVDSSPGKRERLRFLVECLGFEEPAPPEIRYQLLHRTASAIIEARRFGAAHAMLLVHSFSQDKAWLEDYQSFVGLFDAPGADGRVSPLVRLEDVQLHACWVTGEAEYLNT